MAYHLSVLNQRNEGRPGTVAISVEEGEQIEKGETPVELDVETIPVQRGSRHANHRTCEAVSPE